MLSKFAILTFLIQNGENGKKLVEILDRFYALLENGVSQDDLVTYCDLTSEFALALKPVIASFPTGVFAMSVDEEETAFTKLEQSTGVKRPRLKRLIDLFLEYGLPRLLK